MQSLGPLVEYAVFGVLIALSIIAVAITLERLRFYRSMQATRYTSRARLESDLTRRLNIIGTIGANAPYIGLLGTVLGMIDIFSAFMGSQMTANAAVLAGGISKALITTAAGLMVGIPSVFFHRFLQRRIDELVVGMEQEAIKLVEVVQGDRDVDLVEGRA